MPEDAHQDRGGRFEEISLEVRNRDAGRCRCCDVPEKKERLSVHHLIPDVQIPEDYDSHLPVNLVSLCRSCHSKLESKSLRYQLREMGVESQDELMISDEERENLNNRLDATGPDELTAKTISKQESIEFLEQDFSLDELQTGLTEFS